MLHDERQLVLVRERQARADRVAKRPAKLRDFTRDDDAERLAAVHVRFGDVEGGAGCRIRRDHPLVAVDDDQQRVRRMPEKVGRSRQNQRCQGRHGASKT